MYNECDSAIECNGVFVNRGLKPGIDPCRHCGGIHYGSGFACPYLCAICYKDIRPDARDKCRCLSRFGVNHAH